MNKGLIKYFLIFLVIAGVITGLIVNSRHQQELITRDIEINRRKVKAMEEKDVAATEEKLKNIRKEYGINKNDNDSMSVTRYFEDSVFMGDSLSEPLFMYEHLPTSNVIAKMGRNTITALEDVPLLSKIAPSRIFMMYGMNDLNIMDNGQEFKKYYLELINAIKKVKPDSEIIILSVLPVTKEAQADQPTLKTERVDEFNNALKEIADENSFIFMDVRGLIQDESLYEPDGIHLKSQFYTKFLEYIKNEFMTEL